MDSVAASVPEPLSLSSPPESSGSSSESPPEGEAGAVGGLTVAVAKRLPEKAGSIQAASRVEFPSA